MRLCMVGWEVLGGDMWLLGGTSDRPPKIVHQP